MNLTTLSFGDLNRIRDQSNLILSKIGGLIMPVSPVERDIAGVKSDLAGIQMRLDNLDRRVERLARRAELTGA
jgi:hypothetical protein